MEAIHLYAKQLAADSPNRLFKLLNLNLKDRGSYWTCSCPVHEGDNQRGFTLYKGTLNWTCQTHMCHGHKKVGDVFSLISKVKKITYAEAKKLLMATYEIGEIDKEILDKVEFENELKFMSEKSSESKKNDTVPSELIDLYAANKNDYYIKRGYTEDVLKYFQVGFCPADLKIPKELRKYSIVKVGEKYIPYFHNRAVIPIHDQYSNLVGFTGRSIDNTEPKFIHSFGMLKNLILYNMNRADKHINGDLILVESPGVVWSWFKAGYMNVVASMGCCLSKEQANIIARHPKISRVIIAYDSDLPGRNGTEQAAKMLYGKINLLKMEPEDGVDYDSLNPDDLRLLYNKRKVIA